MPFQLRDLSVLSYANGFTLWHYRSTADTMATITAANYFAPASAMVARNDVLVIVGSDGVRQSRVATVAPGAVIVAALTP
jgi:hypothetical protein